jgi:cell division protein FtsB
MQRDVRSIQQQVQEMQQKNAVLRDELRLAQSDAYIEKTAREKIGLVKPGETRVVTVAPGTEVQRVEVPSGQNIIAD